MVSQWYNKNMRYNKMEIKQIIPNVSNKIGFNFDAVDSKINKMLGKNLELETYND